MLLYDLAIHLFALVTLPKIFMHWSKYRATIAPRLGRGFPRIERKRKLIWIHAVSVGETKAILPLIKKFKSLSDPPSIILSTCTKTGHEVGEKSLADWKVYLPFDFSYVIRPIIARVKPHLIVIAETDFWYHFQDEAKKQGAKIIVINAKLSKRSYKRYRFFSLFKKMLLDPIDHFYVQGPVYNGRLQKLGIPSEKITETGNIKLDASVEGITSLELGLAEDHYVITLGSTHAPEERLWLKALKQLWQGYPRIKVLIVPRHPERFDEVAKLLEEEQVSYSRLSQKGTFEKCDVVLVDAMGVLLSCYQQSDLAFVGGSFTSKVGGHNILEPSFFGKPVLFGPYMFSQPDLLELAHFYHSGLQIMPEDIVATVKQCIEVPEFGNRLGENGLKLLAESKGALDKTFLAVDGLLEKVKV